MKKANSYPLIIRLGDGFLLPKPWPIILTLTVLIMLLILATFLDGVPRKFSEWSYWRNFLDGPILTVYILAVYPFVWRSWNKSAVELTKYLPNEGRGLGHLKINTPELRRQWELLTFFLGTATWLLLWRPWSWSDRWKPGVIWLPAYEVLTQTLLFGLLFLAIYTSFYESWRLNRLVRNHVNLDIFSTGVLTPVASSSLGVSIAYIGGISLSLVFQTHKDLMTWMNVIVWIGLVCFAVMIFFGSMLSTHVTIKRVKERELDIVKKYLSQASFELRERVAKSGLQGTEELSTNLNAWLSYERRIKEVPDWPYTASILRSLIASTTVPAAVYVFKVLTGIG